MPPTGASRGGGGRHLSVRLHGLNTAAYMLSAHALSVFNVTHDFRVIRNTRHQLKTVTGSGVDLEVFNNSIYEVAASRSTLVRNTFEHMRVPSKFYIPLCVGLPLDKVFMSSADSVHAGGYATRGVGSGGTRVGFDEFPCIVNLHAQRV